MHSTSVIVLSAATIVAALGLSGCGGETQPAATSSAVVTTTTTMTTGASLPPATDLPNPEALTAVLYRLADTAVPGQAKVGLVEYATADEADDLNKFGQALQDGGLQPVTFEANELTWSTANPGNVLTNVTVRSPNRTETFTFPMEFSPVPDGWQLTRQTADLLLQLGQPRSPTPTG